MTSDIKFNKSFVPANIEDTVKRTREAEDLGRKVVAGKKR